MTRAVVICAVLIAACDSDGRDACEPVHAALADLRAAIRRRCDVVKENASILACIQVTKNHSSCERTFRNSTCVYSLAADGGAP